MLSIICSTLGTPLQTRNWVLKVNWVYVSDLGTQSKVCGFDLSTQGESLASSRTPSQYTVLMWILNLERHTCSCHVYNQIWIPNSDMGTQIWVPSSNLGNQGWVLSPTWTLKSKSLTQNPTEFPVLTRVLKLESKVRLGYSNLSLLHLSLVLMHSRKNRKK